MTTVSLGARRRMERERLERMIVDEASVSDEQIYRAWLDAGDSVMHAAATLGVGTGSVRAVLRRAGILTTTLPHTRTS